MLCYAILCCCHDKTTAAAPVAFSTIRRRMLYPRCRHSVSTASATCSTPTLLPVARTIIIVSTMIAFYVCGPGSDTCAGIGWTLCVTLYTQAPTRVRVSAGLYTLYFVLRLRDVCGHRMDFIIYNLYSGSDTCAGIAWICTTPACAKRLSGCGAPFRHCSGCRSELRRLAPALS